MKMRPCLSHFGFALHAVVAALDKTADGTASSAAIAYVIAHFVDTAAILNSIVSNIYYGMVWGQFEPRPSHNRYLKQ